MLFSYFIIHLPSARPHTFWTKFCYVGRTAPAHEKGVLEILDFIFIVFLSSRIHLEIFLSLEHFTILVRSSDVTVRKVKRLKMNSAR